MSWLGKIFSGSIGSVVKEVGDVADKFHLSGEEKQQFKLELEALLQKRDSEVEETLRAELGAKERILVAELSQGDNYTKRARPTVVYSGLFFIFFNYCFVPLLARWQGVSFEPLALPPEFWYGWSGIVMTWSVGRSFEKSGTSNRLTRTITGSSPSRLLDEEVAKG
ncbi:MAG: 3TM-type holin [Candidatus Desantisbacteria bacterium]